jgi:hypothetical protein
MPAIDNEDDDVTQDIPTLCKSTTETCLEPFRRLLAEINGSASTEGHPPVTCVISDVIMGFSIDVAKERPPLRPALDCQHHQLPRVSPLPPPH